MIKVVKEDPPKNTAAKKWSEQVDRTGLFAKELLVVSDTKIVSTRPTAIKSGQDPRGKMQRQCFHLAATYRLVNCQPLRSPSCSCRLSQLVKRTASSNEEAFLVRSARLFRMVHSAQNLWRMLSMSHTRNTHIHERCLTNSS